MDEIDEMDGWMDDGWMNGQMNVSLTLTRYSTTLLMLQAAPTEAYNSEDDAPSVDVDSESEITLDAQQQSPNSTTTQTPVISTDLSFETWHDAIQFIEGFAATVGFR